MRNVSRALILAWACAVLFAVAGCNEFGEDGNVAEGYAEVTDVELVGNSTTDGEPAILKFTITVKQRGGTATHFSNEVLIELVDVIWVPGAVLGSGTSIVNGGWTPVGSTITVEMFLFADMSEPVPSAVEEGLFTFYGRDNNGHTFSFSHLASVWFTN